MDITRLPEDCISQIISYTSPMDACRSSLVHSSLRAAADSDSVWELFLPPDYREIISQSSSPHLNFFSKKNLYGSLCVRPVLVADNMAFSLEKFTGKKCYMVGAKGIGIIWGNESQYWNWTSIPSSRFPLVAELVIVWWFSIWTRIETKLLSPHTTYGVYFVFKFGRSKQGFENRPVESKLKLETKSKSKRKSEKIVILDTPINGPQTRNDGWKEVEMGEFFNGKGEDGVVVAKLFAFDGNSMEGLIVEGIEFRPKSTG